MNIHNSLVISGIVCMGLTSPAVTYAQAGSLDPTFDLDGIVRTEIGPADEFGRAVAVQADGKIIVVGYSDNGSQDVFALVRYTSDGALDNTFDLDGIVTTEIGTSGNRAHALVIQSDGKIVLAGYSFSSVAGNDFAVARYHVDGSLDLSFDGDGMVTTAFGTYTNDRAFAIALQADGKLLVAGYATDEATTQRDFALVRYNTDGSLDSGFDGDGRAVISIEASHDEARAICVQSDGKIILAGYGFDFSTREFAAVRFNSDGSIDNTFDFDGIVTTAFGQGSTDDAAYSAVLQPDGKLLMAGYSHGTAYDYALARYNTDGSLDATFDSDGMVITSIGTSGSSSDEAFAMTLQPDGKIVVAGHTDYDFSVARYNTNGSLDNTFDADGTLTTDLASSAFYDNIEAITLQADGKILVAGSASNETDYDFTVARYLNSSLGTEPLNLNLNSFEIYPNPISNTASIRISDKLDNVRVTISALTGQVIQEFENFSEEIIPLERRNLQSGMYIVTMVQDGKIIATQRVVVD